MLKWIQRIGILLIGLVALAMIGYQVFKKPISAFLFERFVERAVLADPAADLGDGLHVYMCGTGSPMADANTAGACIGGQGGCFLVAALKLAVMSRRATKRKRKIIHKNSALIVFRDLRVSRKKLENRNLRYTCVTVPEHSINDRGVRTTRCKWQPKSQSTPLLEVLFF